MKWNEMEWNGMEWVAMVDMAGSVIDFASIRSIFARYSDRTGQGIVNFSHSLTAVDITI